MLVLIGLVVAFVLVAVFSNRAMRACRWREHRAGDFTDWHCVQCGARLTLPRGDRPARCLRDTV